MNLDNYGSREACQRLHDAGIVLETDMNWVKCKDGMWVFMFIGDVGKHAIGEVETWISAPSLAEILRELPVYFDIDQCFQPNLVKVADDNKGVMYSAFYSLIVRKLPVPACYQSANPTDALIELRIWLEERKEGT